MSLQSRDLAAVRAAIRKVKANIAAHRYEAPSVRRQANPAYRIMTMLEARFAKPSQSACCGQQA